MTAYEMLVAAETAIASKSGAESYLIAQGIKPPKAKEAATRFWNDRHPAPPPPPPPPPPSSDPSFLSGLGRQVHDDCTNPDPVKGKRYAVYSAERLDHVEVSTQYPHTAAELMPGRFIPVASGGPGGKPYYHFYAPPGDRHQWTNDGVYGRSELGYPIGDPGNVPATPGPVVDGRTAFFGHEGRRQVYLFATRLPAPWNINGANWRVICQWKQNEWVDTGGVSPVCSFQQRGGKFVICNEPDGQWHGDDVVWSMPAAVGQWHNWAFDYTWSANPNKGKIKVYCDKNMDGQYEVVGDTITTGTLFPKYGISQPGVPCMSSIGCYEDPAGDGVDIGPGSTGGIDIYG